MQINKKILASIVIIGLLALALGWGTYSWFSDTETSTGNKFTAGKLDLKIDKDPDGAMFDWIDDPEVPTMQACFGDPIIVKPGDSMRPIVGIKNEGNVEGRADIHIKNVFDADNGQEEPEPATGIDGDLSRAILVKIYYGDKSAGKIHAPEHSPEDTTNEWIPVTGWITLYDIDCNNFNAPATMPGGEDDFWVIEFKIPTSVGNEIMGDTVTFDIEFSLNQEAA